MRGVLIDCNKIFIKNWNSPTYRLGSCAKVHSLAHSCARTASSLSHTISCMFCAAGWAGSKWPVATVCRKKLCSSSISLLSSSVIPDSVLRNKHKLIIFVYIKELVRFLFLLFFYIMNDEEINDTTFSLMEKFSSCFNSFRLENLFLFLSHRRGDDNDKMNSHVCELYIRAHKFNIQVISVSQMRLKEKKTRILHIIFFYFILFIIHMYNSHLATWNQRVKKYKLED